MHVKCPRCDGTGKHNGFDCALCGGRGHVEVVRAKAYIANFDSTIPFWNQDDHRREEG
jgi:DnaJ-class molecular chaperone